MDQRNVLLKRREVKLTLESDKNPGFEGVRKMIADKFKVDENIIVVKSVKSAFGRNSFVIDSVIYDSVEDRNMIEPKKREKAKKGGA